LCSPVIRPPTTRLGWSGPSTSSVQPRLSVTNPSASAADSSARVTVVPTAITRPPEQRTSLTSRAVVAGTANRSGCGPSPASCEDTPVCKVIGAISTPAETSLVTSSVLNGRPALGISALPGIRPNTVW